MATIASALAGRRQYPQIQLANMLPLAEAKRAGTALIPSYQPDRHLFGVLESLRACGFELVVVDDGSGPEYRSLFERARNWAHVITHERNLGKGEAIKTGLRYIDRTCNAAEIIVTVDGDGQHDANDVARCAEQAQAHPDNLVLGVRSFNGNVPLRSRAGNAAMKLAFRLATKTAVYDTQTGLRAFSSKLIPWLLRVKGSRYEYEMNMLLEAARSGIAMTQVPIQTIYENNNESSHFSPVSDSLRIGRELLRFAGSSLICFGIDFSLYSLIVMLASSLGAAGIALANIIARLVSATCNFLLNRNVVFKSDADIVRSALQYAALAACILAGNTIVLELATQCFAANPYLAKIGCELGFFTISWLVQRNGIFRNGRRETHDQ